MTINKKGPSTDESERSENIIRFPEQAQSEKDDSPDSSSPDKKSSDVVSDDQEVTPDTDLLLHQCETSLMECQDLIQSLDVPGLDKKSGDVVLGEQEVTPDTDLLVHQCEASLMKSRDLILNLLVNSGHLTQEQIRLDSPSEGDCLIATEDGLMKLQEFVQYRISKLMKEEEDKYRKWKASRGKED